MNDSPSKEAFRRFKESKWNLPVAFITVLLLDIALLWASVNSPTDACLAGILISVISVFGFVWLGVKDPKRVLISVTVVFLVLSPIYANMYTDALYSLEYPMDMDSDRFEISQVDVRPYVGSASTQNFNFTATVPGNATNISLVLKVLTARGMNEVYGGNMSRMNATDGSIFYSNISLDAGSYVFRVVVYENGDLVDGTDMIYYYGPENMEKGDFFSMYIPYAFVTVFLQIGGLSYILAGMYWWTRIARGRRREAVTVRKNEEEGTQCPICEQRIPYGTKTCPYCGAELEYDAEDEKKEESADKETVSEENTGSSEQKSSEEKEES